MTSPASWPAPLLGLLLTAGNAVAQSAPPTPAAVTGWDVVPVILARIVPPTFPPREFHITHFGAVANDTNLCTEAFRAAVAACHAAGGGRVIVPPAASTPGQFIFAATWNCISPRARNSSSATVSRTTCRRCWCAWAASSFTTIRR